MSLICNFYFTDFDINKNTLIKLHLPRNKNTQYFRNVEFDDMHFSICTLYKYENICLFVCLLVQLFLSNFETYWQTYKAPIWSREGFNTKYFDRRLCLLGN